MLTLILTGCDTSGTEVTWNTQEDQTAELTESEIFRENITEVCTEEEPPVYADICGAVNQPGVYALKDGARVYELIEKAGGLCEDADITLINQAEEVRDGMKVRVYTKEEAAEVPVRISEDAEERTRSDARININTADLSQLMMLSGIGESRAADIIAYRTENGKFLTIEEIMNVSGIKESTFRKIKDKIVVE